ncbi:hypothetical protein [Streptococcus sp. FT1-55]|uniref:hypothetical protein n=1 Tax=Streptococcus sp. FT1-55 TaxID=3409805 RepID=UPI003BF51DEE
MNRISNFLDRVADRVQTFTGEKERKELVQKSKDKYMEFKEIVENYVSFINDKIFDFNQLIQKINNYRSSQVQRNLNHLYIFLGKFGNVKKLDDYKEEQSAVYLAIPQKEFEIKESYIAEIDWNKDEVFINSFLYGTLGIKQITKQQNLSMIEQLEKFKLEIEATKRQFDIKKYNIQKDKEVAELYLECIFVISDYISRCILPELEVVEAFFQSLIIKNKIIAGNQLQNIVFTNDLLLLKDTPYEEHYQFVKNAFMFYIISCKIFDTPVLTKLINSQVDNSDLALLQENKEILLEQKNKVNKYLMFTRGKINGK